MTAAAAMGGIAGVVGVLAAWEALAAIDQHALLRAMGRWLAPLRRDRAPSAAERRRLVAVAAATLLAAGWLLAGPVVALVLACGAPLLGGRVVAWRAARRRAAFAAAAAPVARVLADALAGGHAVRGALTAAARAGALRGPASEELRAAGAALDLGEPTEGVLERLRIRADDRAWDTLVAAILLQRDAGGDLARLLRDLAARLDEARRADADARSATAQARFTAWLVAALPAGAAVLAELGSPGYLGGLLSAPLTALLAGTSCGLQLTALLIIRRIARVPT